MFDDLFTEHLANAKRWPTLAEAATAIGDFAPEAVANGEDICSGYRFAFECDGAEDGSFAVVVYIAREDEGEDMLYFAREDL